MRSLSPSPTYAFSALFFATTALGQHVEEGGGSWRAGVPTCPDDAPFLLKVRWLREALFHPCCWITPSASATSLPNTGAVNLPESTNVWPYATSRPMHGIRNGVDH
jgi:hypothetical protein